MGLTKGDIVRSVMEVTRVEKPERDGQQYLFPELDYQPLTKKQATALVDTLLDIIKERLAEGEDVLLTGFGKFQVKFKWARKGRNPQTGETIILNSRRAITFHCSRKLRDKINNPETPGPSE